MGIMDEAKGKMEEAKDLLSKGAEKAEEAIEKAGDAIDSKTEGKFKETVDKVQDAAQESRRQGQNAALTHGQTFRLRRRSSAAGAGVGLRVGPVPLQGMADFHRVWRKKLPDTWTRARKSRRSSKSRACPTGSSGQ